MIKQTTLITALLSSSCCVIQLVLNFFSFSCAGFAVLTPHRAWLTAASMLLLTLQFHTHGWTNKRVWATAIASLLLMTSPEMVQWINQRGLTDANLGGTVLHLEGLACMACANRIKNALLAIDGVESAQVFFENSSAVVQYKHTTPTALQELLMETVKGVDPTRYKATVLQYW